MANHPDEVYCPICGERASGIISYGPGPESTAPTNGHGGPEPTSLTLRFRCENGNEIQNEYPFA